jgi:predicted RNase H-like nuclease (RuvC/YqgF family)
MMDDEITIHSSKGSTKYIKWDLHSQLMEADRKSSWDEVTKLKMRIANKQTAIEELQSIAASFRNPEKIKALESKNLELRMEIQILNENLNAKRNEVRSLNRELVEKDKSITILKGDVQDLYQAQVEEKETPLNDGQLLTIKMANEQIKILIEIGCRWEGLIESKFIKDMIKINNMISSALQIIESYQPKTDDPEQVQVKRPDPEKFLVRSLNGDFSIVLEGEPFPNGCDATRLNDNSFQRLFRS